MSLGEKAILTISRSVIDESFRMALPLPHNLLPHWRRARLAFTDHCRVAVTLPMATGEQAHLPPHYRGNEYPSPCSRDEKQAFASGFHTQSWR